MQVLLRDHDGQPLGLQLEDRIGHLFHDDRGDAFRRFVQQQQGRVAHQGPCDGQHLLFAARHLLATVGAAFCEVGEDLEQLLDGPVGRVLAFGLAADLQVFHHRQVGEDAAILGDIADAGLGDAVGRLAHQVIVLEHHPARTRADQLHHRFHRCGLARTVAAQKCHDLAPAHLERQAVQDVGLAVIAVNAFDVKHPRPP